MCPDQLGSYWDPNPSTGDTSNRTGVETEGGAIMSSVDTVLPEPGSMKSLKWIWIGKLFMDKECPLWKFEPA